MLSQGADKVHQIPPEIFHKMPYIRVLDLSRTNITELPSTIDKLRHLRHLDVSNTNIESLPESITKLRGLETIKLNNCLQFRHLPKDMKNLTNLRHLELDIQRQINSMPAQFGRLTNLETLSAFLVAKEKGQQIEELKDMNCLRGAICITNLENVTNNEEAAAAKLDQKAYLDNLKLEWEVEYHLTAPEVLGGLRPHNLIKELTVSGYSGATFPDWLTSQSLCMLQSVYLHNCYKCVALPSLGQLPMLNSLYIHNMPDLDSIDENFTGRGMSFPSLLKLKLNNMPKLRDWTDFQIGNMPKLCHLQLDNCPILQFLPSLGCLTSLEKLETSRCRQVQFSPNGEVPESLNFLIITQCDVLRPDENMINSISYVEVDGQIPEG